MALRYKCIVIDHDDTTVDSTPSIHHPAYLEFCKEHKPELTPLTLAEWYQMLWEYNYLDYTKNVMKLTSEEQEMEFKHWISYVAKRKPVMFDGFLDMLTEFRKRGGIICVCSHSQETSIRRHYEELTNGQFEPDMVFGYVREHPEMCKPHTYPIETIKTKYTLDNKDILVVDDLYPGIEMAQTAKVDCVGVTYGKGHELIYDRLKNSCKFIFESVESLKNFLLSVEEE
ncbi:Phosphoglycolate phosphatase [Entamoeba marina]